MSSILGKGIYKKMHRLLGDTFFCMGVFPSTPGRVPSNEEEANWIVILQKGYCSLNL